LILHQIGLIYPQEYGDDNEKMAKIVIIVMMVMMMTTTIMMMKIMMMIIIIIIIAIIIIIIKALNTKYYATKILNTQTDSKCRLCQQFGKTIDHIRSACPILAKEQYVKRHDKVSAQLHINICKEIGVKKKKKHWYSTNMYQNQ
jgi:ABC-type multidrug transport system fused ATPase/permease subunit